MTFDLTLVDNPTFDTAGGAYGQSLIGGSGYAAEQPITAYPFTIRSIVRGTASGVVEVIGGRAEMGWIGKAANNTAVAHYGPGGAGTGNGNDITLGSNINITDGADHILELKVTENGGTFWVDGVIRATSLAKPLTFTAKNQRFGVRAFYLGEGGTTPSYKFGGAVRELSVFTSELHVENYTPDTAPAVGNEPGLVALWRLNGDGTNSAGAAIPGDTTGPSFLSAQVVNASPNVIQVTMSEALAASLSPAGAWTPSGGRTATAVSHTGNVAYVTVDPPCAASEVLSIAYAQPSANPRMQDAAGNPAPSFAAQSVANNIAAPVTGAYDPTKILFSPGNWDIQNGFAKTINAGAYLRTCFGGGSCTLAFDMTNVAAVAPKLTYRVDEFGPWVTVDLAANIVITVPADTAAYPAHILELRVRSTSEASARWAGGGVKLIGVSLSAGKALAIAPALNGDAWVFGDSISEGILTVKSGGDTTVRSDSGQSYAYVAMRMLGLECGLIAFGRQGLTMTGTPDVPVFGSTYNMLYSGVARSFAKAPRLVLINHGTNDGNANILAAATAVLNNLLAALPTSTKIFVMRPFNGSGATHWVNAIAACSAPARVAYIDTTGWYNTVNSPDVLHPNGFENVSNLGPRTAAAIRAILDDAPPPPVLTQRTITITLKKDSPTTGQPAVPAANLTGLKGSFYDEDSAGKLGVARHQFENETTDANGFLSFVCGTTRAPGDGGNIVLEGPGGMHYNGAVTVS